MSADPANGQSNIEVILKGMAPDRREAFLKSRNRLKQFNENDEILALAHYLDTVVVMVDGLTKNVAAACAGRFFSGAGYRPNANNLIAWQPL